MIKEIEIEKVLDRNGVIEHGDFVLSSGFKTKKYINKHKIYRDRKLFTWVIHSLSDMITNEIGTHRFETIVGPEHGGMILASALAFHLDKDFAFTIEGDLGTSYGKHYIKDEYKDAVNNKHILLVDDIITTGGTAEKIERGIGGLNPTVVAIACIWNRGVARDFFFPTMIHSLVNIPIEIY